MMKKFVLMALVMLMSSVAVAQDMITKEQLKEIQLSTGNISRNQVRQILLGLCNTYKVENREARVEEYMSKQYDEDLFDCYYNVASKYLTVEDYKYSIEKRSDLPGFSDIKGIFVNGIKTVIVEIAYMILPFILFLLGLMLTVNEAVSSSVNTIGGILVVIAMIFLIFAALVEIMAICNMVAKDDLKAAFDFKGILAQIKSIGWGRFIGIIIFSGVVIAIISVFFEMIFGAIATGLSILIGSALVMVLTKTILDSLLVNPYISIVLSRVYGSIYREANSLE